MKRLIAVLAIMPTIGFAETVSGNDLYSACTATGDVVDLRYGYCIGYIGGAFEGIKLGAGAIMFQAMREGTAAEVDQASNELLGICVPETVERGQIVDVAIQYMAKNPQIRHESARGLLLQSMQEAFPC
ncbi:Rap1a/Tai family immunity protein [Yoonia vestfoldensis]|uniref:Rap1a immunity protein domain-containing protein n=1 Tax=Yoonia vestfoldensis TaxID=245188 RepID=A0A1Y0EHP0_9RHOB|nr:Rap1a/Tai family immunity protein [Yoonia vestfoldensis]ARU02958.1 hypothetical protein LOKVESSMR4R_03692 [Yoonia vestfoldensis]